MARLPKPEKLQGWFINLREITIGDAKFVLDLRCDEKKSKYLNKTEYNLEKQIDYINNYLKKDDEWEKSKISPYWKKYFPSKHFEKNGFLLKREKMYWLIQVMKF